MKKIKHTPAGHRLLVKVDAPEELTKGGIVIPEKIKDRESAGTETGILVAIGKTAFLSFDDGEPWAEVNDRVCFIRHAGHLLKINNEDYRIINDVDLLSIIEEAEEENHATN